MFHSVYLDDRLFQQGACCSSAVLLADVSTVELTYKSVEVCFARDMLTIDLLLCFVNF